MLLFNIKNLFFVFLRPLTTVGSFECCLFLTNPFCFSALAATAGSISGRWDCGSDDPSFVAQSWPACIPPSRWNFIPVKLSLAPSFLNPTPSHQPGHSFTTHTFPQWLFSFPISAPLHWSSREVTMWLLCPWTDPLWRIGGCFHAQLYWSGI